MTKHRVRQTIFIDPPNDLRIKENLIFSICLNLDEKFGVEDINISIYYSGKIIYDDKNV